LKFNTTNHIINQKIIIMKKLSTLLFLLMVVILYSNAQTDCEPATINNVEREGNGNQITWKMPPTGEEVTISQGGEYAYNYGIAFGAWNEIKSAGAYHRFTPEHLAIINGGELTQVVFVPHYSTYFQQKPGHTHTIQIYEGGNWGEPGARHPGTLIASQELDNTDLIFFQENSITLTTPITIDASLELWIGYYCTDIDTIHDVDKDCAGADNGPRNEGFGNVMIYENQWITNYERNETFYNFVIKGIVETIDGATVNIYFNDNELVSNFLGTTYFHDTPAGEEHCYTVEVNCLEGGVSPLSDEFCIDGVGIKHNEMANFSVYPNPAKNELRITPVSSEARKLEQLRIVDIEIFDIYGRNVNSKFKIQNSEFVIDISTLSSGVYFVRLIDEQGAAVQKFIKE
jgi:hypothetical protein